MIKIKTFLTFVKTPATFLLWLLVEGILILCLHMNSFWKKQFFGDEPEPLMIDDKRRRFRCDTGIHLNFPENSKMKLLALAVPVCFYAMGCQYMYMACQQGLPNITNNTWFCPKVFSLHLTAFSSLSIPGVCWPCHLLVRFHVLWFLVVNKIQGQTCTPKPSRLLPGPKDNLNT